MSASPSLQEIGLTIALGIVTIAWIYIKFTGRRNQLRNNETMEEESKDQPGHGYEALTNKTNRSDEEYLSHEEYVARNNSCSSMDEDDLDGELNLSDDGSD